MLSSLSFYVIYFYYIFLLYLEMVFLLSSIFSQRASSRSTIPFSLFILFIHVFSAFRTIYLATFFLHARITLSFLENYYQN